MKPGLIFLTVVLVIAGFFIFDYYRPAETVVVSSENIDSITDSASAAAAKDEKSLEERVREAKEKSAQVKGVYMTSIVANGSGRAAEKLRKDIEDLLDTTELNGVVIDVKETEGGAVITDQLKEFIGELHQKKFWVIARQVAFKDSSQEKERPEWYLQTKSGAIWRDNRRGSWLDPASLEVWAYQAEVAKKALDAGFDEVQFDYIRFPSDGNISNIVYPVYDAKKPKYEVLAEFFKYLNREIKTHKPEAIISADLFGYVALQKSDLGIGQRLVDIGQNFDYISLMVYPSHYYSGFQVGPDPARDLGPLFYPYQSKDITNVVSNKPYDVVYRSILIARDTLDGKIATTTLGSMVGNGTSMPGAGYSDATTASSTAKLRPWLQDFDLAVDSNRGIVYDASKVRAEIDAAEDAGSSGWLLWSANNVYTREALKPKPDK